MSVCRADNSVWWVAYWMALFTARTATPRSVSRRMPSRTSSVPSTVSLWAVTHPYREALVLLPDDDRQPHAGL